MSKKKLEKEIEAIVDDSFINKRGEAYYQKTVIVDDVLDLIKQREERIRLEAKIEELERQNITFSIGHSTDEYDELDVLKGNKKRTKQLQQQLSKLKKEK